MNQMIWNEKTGKMEKVGKAEGETAKVSISAELVKKLEAFAREDGYDFSGTSYVTEKDAKGNTKKDKDGKPVFVLENDKPKKVTTERSQAKVNSAIGDYVDVAVNLLIKAREEAKAE